MANYANSNDAWSKRNLKSTPVKYSTCTEADYKRGYEPLAKGPGKDMGTKPPGGVNSNKPTK